MGFTYQMQQFQEERLWGAATRSAGSTTPSATPSNTRATGRSSAAACCDNQVVHFTLAELQTEVEALRALVYRATELLIGGPGRHATGVDGQAQGGTPLARSSGQVPAVLGRHGVHVGEPRVTRLFRDGRLGSIGGGADEVMLSIICKLNGTLSRPGT